MNYFDLHCDTLSKMNDDKTVPKENLQVSLKDNRLFEKYCQCFALWMPDELCGKEACKRAESIFPLFEKEKQAFEKQKNRKALLTMENAGFIGENTDSFALWKKRGVVAASLTWNGKNAYAHGAHCKSGGLTELGKHAVKQLENSEIILDVSHLNRDSFFDVCKISKKAFIASHSNCGRVRKNARNLTDRQIHEIVQRGGLIGICFYPPFLGKGDVFEQIYKNIVHLFTLGAENCICFGSDFDGAAMSERLDKTEKVGALYAFLQSRGIGQELLEKFFYENAEKFFKTFYKSDNL